MRNTLLAIIILVSYGANIVNASTSLRTAEHNINEPEPYVGNIGEIGGNALLLNTETHGESTEAHGKSTTLLNVQDDIETGFGDAAEARDKSSVRDIDDVIGGAALLRNTEAGDESTALLSVQSGNTRLIREGVSGGATLARDESTAKLSEQYSPLRNEEYEITEISDVLAGVCASMAIRLFAVLGVVIYMYFAGIHVSFHR